MATQSEPEQFPFQDVLRDELEVIAARRDTLESERGDLADTGPRADETAAHAAWQARLLGLSFSGGGIRSATFNLGVLQALARCGLLRYVDYLSTVSGGGYIGSWLTALSQRRFAREAVPHDEGEHAGTDGEHDEVLRPAIRRYRKQVEAPEPKQVFLAEHEHVVLPYRACRVPSRGF